MPWARLDDTFATHPKVQDALDDPRGMEALGLWTLCLARSYTPSLNSPHVNYRMAQRFAGNVVEPLAAVLVSVGLWELSDDGDGWVIHDWTEYRPPFDSTEARSLGGKVRAATAARKGGKFASGKAVDNNQQEPAGTSSPGTSRPGQVPGTSRNQQAPGHPDPYPLSNPKVPSGTRGVKGGPRHFVAPAYMTSVHWEPFLDAWFQRFRMPPTEAQAEALWEAVDAYPQASGRFVLDCPQGTKASDVISSVLDRFHSIRADAIDAAALAEVAADAARRERSIPRNGQGMKPLAAILDDLPM